jgi:opacity protein-like surface antigen
MHALRPSLLALVWLCLGNSLAWGQYDPVYKEYHEPMRSYGWVEIGGAQVQDFNATLGGVATNGAWQQDLGMKLGTGFAVNGGFGDTFSRWVSMEFLAGFLYNNLEDVTGPAGAVGPVNGTLMQVPLLLNLVVHVPVSERFQPFVGAGAGAVISWLDLDQTVQANGGEPLHLHGSSTEFTFAYQVFGGLAVRLRPDARLTLTYRFQGSGSPTWSLDEIHTGYAAANLQADEIFTQSLTLGFQISL